MKPQGSSLNKPGSKYLLGPILYNWVLFKRVHQILCHMIFDVKMEDFWQKVRLVAGGHWTKAPATITYASVVSCETVCLALTIVSLNDLEVKVGDVLNAYITTPVKEKVWTILGPEFGHDSGRSAIIVHALYGLKSAGAAFWAHLASFMRQMGYTSCKADLTCGWNLWLDLRTMCITTPTSYALLMTYCAYTTTLCQLWMRSTAIFP